MVFLVVNWILSLLGNIPSFPSGVVTEITSYISTVVSSGAGLLFFLIRPSTFFAALDIVTFMFIAEPLYHFVMWVLRKVPFLGID